MTTAPETTEQHSVPKTGTPPTIARTGAGAGHIAVALAHWAGGHTIGPEEITRRIVKQRSEAHQAAVAEHARAARAAHKRARRLKQRAQMNGGLVGADLTALAAAEQQAAHHDSAMSALGEFTIPVLDPGQIRHHRHRVAAVRCVVLTLPVGGIVAGSWLWTGSVFLFSVVGAVGACLARGNRPFELTVRSVPAELIAATPHVLPEAPAELVEPVPVGTGAWREELRLYVEHAVAHADLEGRASVHVAELLHGLQSSGRFLGLTTKTFPAKLADAGIPYRVAKIGGQSGNAVRYDALAQALGHQPRLPAHLVPDHTTDEPGESPSPNRSPATQATAG
ncbi:hypothetical protein [Kitasatospora purpeofusca]|uniref:hypothetical protein n=1 Tax=Kitasatospora purpeofusca TaxID=67352 RepID=UPI002252115B|nr:hypothetical protein [Kitasatospora purpeofusca]MCX4752910.1 hypothetical protein [Kitasatospora purpeofusca]WSR32453.1 hypothetical protein OG715_16555 [Kitasatospora purpeofusca]WSR40541.1 hypothetical protein OG196_16340 [Kitasatospora purpeofusca]